MIFTRVLWKWKILPKLYLYVYLTRQQGKYVFLFHINYTCTMHTCRLKVPSTRKIMIFLDILATNVSHILLLVLSFLKGYQLGGKAVYCGLDESVE